MFPDLWSYSSVGIALFFGTATTIERRAYNAEAVGSNPTRTTISIRTANIIRIFISKKSNTAHSTGPMAQLVSAFDC